MNILNNPAINERFFGRKDELDFLYKKVENFKKGYRQNLAVLGPKQSGKTSLLLNFASNIEKKEFIPVYVDLASVSFESFKVSFIGTLLYNYFSCELGISNFTYKELLVYASKNLPKTHKQIELINVLSSAKDEKAALEATLDLTSFLSTEAGRKCVIIFDNFRRFENFGIKDTFSILGEKIMLHHHAMYIFSDSGVEASRHILSEKFSLLFGKFHIIILKQMNSCEALGLINNRFPAGSISDECKQFLIYLTNADPFYLDVILGYIRKKCNHKDTDNLSSNIFVSALIDGIFDAHSPINVYLTRMLEGIKAQVSLPETLKILDSIIENNKINKITSASGCKRKCVQDVLDYFIQNEIVSKNGPLYSICDDVLKVWISVLASEDNYVFSNEYSCSKKDTALKKIKEAIDDFKISINKAIDSRMINLISAFDNEKVQVGRRTHILPAFKHIRAEYSAKDDVFVSAHGSKLWYFSVYRNFVKEADVLDFIDHCRKNKHKISRKVLIALADISPEAKLLAMEERIWIWTKSKINDVLSLYRKPKIHLT